MSEQPLSYSSLLQAKIILLKQMFDLVVDQEKALEIGQEKALDQIVKLRKSVFDKLERLDNTLAKYTHQDEKDAEKCRQLDMATREWMEKIYALDKVNLEKAKQYQNDLQANMQHIMSGKNAIQNGYFKTMPQLGGYFIDQKIGNKK